MNYKVVIAGDFRITAKALSKKYPSLKTDITTLIESLKVTPAQGDKIYKNTFKVRLSITSKGKGKSGGARVITHVVAVLNEGTVYLLTIYDKSERSTISDKEIKEFIKNLE